MAIYRQTLTAGGKVGAVLAVMAPTIAIGVASWSIGGAVSATSHYSSRSVSDYHVSPIIYVALVFMSVLGWVLLLIGRELTDAPRPKTDTKFDYYDRPTDKADNKEPSLTEQYFGKPAAPDN
ncbi:hypothetical protein [Sinirhodobacter huangdaonensis]|uniref:Uncharacterized protein n=1 Tax=Paenirhodobacter huangdaonensis TaxID=2501515 RepID=A0A3S3LBG8_9RHOB|nr:hypothetical protein [Sinirhodobacter huangdaonensis]RWR50338.1 hypothetical protein EOW66_15145 [Sinirhodobacter huangdaonensis]